MTGMEKDFDIFIRLFLLVPDEEREKLNKDIEVLAHAELSTSLEIFNSVYNIYQLYEEAKSSQYINNRISAMTREEKESCARVEMFLAYVKHLYS